MAGVDAGGTFTDCVLFEGDRLLLAKLPTTPDDPSKAVADSLHALDPDCRASVVHGTTVATNALLERRGTRTAFLATEGMGDMLLIGRGVRSDLYALEPRQAEPLVPEELCFEVPERLGADGWTIKRLDDAGAARIARRIAASGAESVAVCLLFSFLDDAHEVRMARAIALTPGAPGHVSVSSRVLPVFREYERAATTVANAYVGPLISGYVGRLHERMAGRPLVVMASHGGAMTVAQAQALPAATALSGPAAGVMGAWQTAGRCGRTRVISLDMGGTSTDVALCDGRIPHRSAHAVGGWPIALPGVSIETVGAGGGSVIEVDSVGALSVGPRSAGALPGPAAYGRGGELPTLTDAMAVLGRLPEGHPLAGGLRLRTDLARRAMEVPARRLGIEPVDVALGAVAVANATMERALRVVSIADGHDPCDFTLVAFGGAGPLHACELADAIGVSDVIVPRSPGALSALGLAIAPRRGVVSRSVRGVSGPHPQREALHRILEALAERARALAGPDAEVTTVAETRYKGQSWEIAVDWPDGVDLAEAFHLEHERRFGYHRPDATVEVVTVRAIATAPSPFALPSGFGGGSVAHARSPVVVAGGGVVDALVVDRAGLRVGEVLAGPAIVTQEDATTWVAPGWRATLGEWGDLHLGPLPD